MSLTLSVTVEASPAFNSWAVLTVTPKPLRIKRRPQVQTKNPKDMQQHKCKCIIKEKVSPCFLLTYEEKPFSLYKLN